MFVNVLYDIELEEAKLSGEIELGWSRSITVSLLA